MSSVLILTQAVNSRVKYVFDVIFGEMLGITPQYTLNESEYRSASCAKLRYGVILEQKNDIFFDNSYLLFEKKIIQPQLSKVSYFDFPCFFPVLSPDSHWPFDPFAYIFFLLTRYEEYLPAKRDQHGRFPAYSSLAFQNEFLHIPVVDILVDYLYKDLKKMFPNLGRKKRYFSFHPTFDIDMPWSYKNKGWLLNSFSGFRNLIQGDWPKLSERVQVLFNRKPDPYFTFPHLLELTDRHHLCPTWFFPVGPRGRFDKNIPLPSKPYQQLILNLSEKGEIGIHPSYRSNLNKIFVKSEKKALENVTKQIIHKSRQHYLMVKFPETYRNLLELGIREEYSMGYAELPGFRAGIAGSFHWYDLQREEITDLRIFPFHVMDITFQQYQKLSPKEAFESVCKIIDTIYSIKGEFVTIWHNDSFSETDNWKGWSGLFSQILLYMEQKEGYISSK